MSETTEIQGRHFGTTQSQRKLDGLRADYVQVDDREDSQLMQFGAEFSKLIKYYNTFNRHEGNWESFFLHDPSIFLAWIIHSDVESWMADLRNFELALERETKQSNQMDYLHQIFKIAYRPIRQANSWYIWSVEQTQRSEFNRYLESSVAKSLKSEFDLLLGFQNSLSQYLTDLPKPTTLEFSDLNAVWGLGPVLPTTPLDEWVADPSEENIMAEFGNLLEVIISLVWTINRRLFAVIERAKVALPESLKRDNIPANVSMFLAFIKLYKHSQDHMNTLVGRHLDFYYRDVLRQKEQEAVPDGVRVLLELAPEQAPFLLPTGTRLDAGKSEEGIQRIYTTNQDLFLGSVQLEKAYTICIANGPDPQNEENPDLVVTGIYAKEIPKPTTAKINKADQSFIPWKTFGEDQLGLGSSEQSMEEVNMGFAVASPLLGAEEGHRQFRVILSFTADSAAGLLADLGTDNNRIYDSAFSLRLSTAKGWMDLLPNVIQYAAAENTLEFAFELQPSEPAIVPYDAELHGPGYSGTLPVLEVQMINEPYNPVYTHFRNLRMNQVQVGVKVTGLKRFTIANDQGKLSSEQSFPLFGSAPMPGNAFYFSHPELLKKPIKELLFVLEWEDLPKKGFRDYFAPYNIEYQTVTSDKGVSTVVPIPVDRFDERRYEVELQSLNNAVWVPKETGSLNQWLYLLDGDVPRIDEEKNLFSLTRKEVETLVKQHTQEDHVLTDVTVFPVDMGELQIQPQAELPEPFEYSNKVNQGFFRILLNAPEDGFGSKLYPEVMTQVSLRNSQIAYINAKDDKSNPYETMPNKPYLPMAKSLSAWYTAEAVWEAGVQTSPGLGEDICLFHLGPFGTYTAVDSNDPEVGAFGGVAEVPLMPDLDDEGYLMLGFTGVEAPEGMALMLELDETSGNAMEVVPDAVSFWYLSGNEWKDLGPYVQSDDTRGFVRSGIIQFTFPEDITTEHLVMPAGHSWVAFSVPTGINLYSHTIQVNPYAVETTNALEDGTVHKLPVGTITKSLDKFPAIKEVKQPFPSRGGRQRENSEAFQLRVSERLRHKQRGIQVWDYERLVLEAFPWVHSATCLSAASHPDIEPGLIRMVLIPEIDPTQPQNRLQPAAPSSRLDAVRQYLEKVASPFVRIEVMNPSYEEITVSCAVLFEDRPDIGLLKERLSKALVSFITPWAYQSDELVLKGQIRLSEILGFIQKIPYVRFVTGFSVLHRARIDGEWFEFDTASQTLRERKESITPIQAAGFLVSSPKHNIRQLTTEKVEQPERHAIGNMVLGTDFMIGSSDSDDGTGANNTTST